MKVQRYSGSRYPYNFLTREVMYQGPLNTRHNDGGIHQGGGNPVAPQLGLPSPNSPRCHEGCVQYFSHSLQRFGRRRDFIICLASWIRGFSSIAPTRVAPFFHYCEPLYLICKHW